ncbi:uncharacterized protein BO95DRAFT_442519, partial [Aspergillus brunneoviolaceus CBS 621.78]
MLFQQRTIVWLVVIAAYLRSSSSTTAARHATRTRREDLPHVYPSPERDWRTQPSGIIHGRLSIAVPNALISNTKSPDPNLRNAGAPSEPPPVVWL